MSTMEEPLLHTTKGVEAKLEKSYFEVMGLCCSSEVTLVEALLKPLPGVHDISVVVPTKTVIVVHDISALSPPQIAEALNQARLEASVRPREERSYTKRWPGGWNIACGVLLALSFLKYVYPPMKWLAIGAVLIGSPTIIMRSVASIKNLTLNINVIVLIAVLGTIALQDYSDAGIIVFLYNIAQWLESRASHRAMSVMSSLTSMAPQKATLAETGEQIDVTRVKLGTIIAVKAGELVPIDGVVVEGKCEVDEKALTGESFPVTKEKGSTVWAGTINLSGYVSVKTTTIAENCLVARMVNLVEEAQSRKARVQTFIDSCAKWYIPAVVFISAGVAVIPIILHASDQMFWLHLALIVLVSACPCALVISTPVTIFCALSKAATTGLLFKGGDYLELLAKVKTVAFDKTGTITRGEFVVTHFHSLHETISTEKLLFWVSSIESKSSHPMAAALVKYAVLNSIVPIPEKVENFQNYPGEGIYGKIDGEHVFIGNYRISLRAGCKENYNNELNNLEEKASGFIYVGETLVGTFGLSDECRSGVTEALKELNKMGIRTAMLTGDNDIAAQQVQNQLGQALDTVHAQLLPEDKARIIEDLKKDGVVAMVGDGINDALALSMADIGISMGISGSALAMETGHVILMSNDIRKIPQAIQISKRASRKIVQNVVISFSTKGVVLALALVGYPMLLAAVLTDVGTCLLVILNSMLLLGGDSKDETVSSFGDSCCDTKTCKKEVSKGKTVSKLGSSCCDATTCKKEVKYSVSKEVDCCGTTRTVCQANRSSVGCCDQQVKKVNECCDEEKGCTKFKGLMEKNGAGTSNRTLSEVTVGSCCNKVSSSCRGRKCRSSAACNQSSLQHIVIS